MTPMWIMLIGGIFLMMVLALGIPKVGLANGEQGACPRALAKCDIGRISGGHIGSCYNTIGCREDPDDDTSTGHSDIIIRCLGYKSRGCRACPCHCKLHVHWSWVGHTTNM